MFRAGERTPASRRRWRWTAAGLSSRVSCVVASEKRGRPQGGEKEGDSHMGCVRGPALGPEDSHVGHARGPALGPAGSQGRQGRLGTWEGLGKEQYRAPPGRGREQSPLGLLTCPQGPSVEGRPPPSLCQAAVRAGVLARTHAMRKAKPAGDGWLTAERPMPLPRTHGGRGPAGGPQAPLVLKKKNHYLEVKVSCSVGGRNSSGVSARKMK